MSTPLAPQHSPHPPETPKKPPQKLKTNVEVPLFLCTVSCGFPSPADDYIETPLDLNDLLIPKPAATFIVRAKGDSMEGAGIYEGDLIIIDRSLTPLNNHVVLAILDGEFTLKRYVTRANKIYLVAENTKYKPILIAEEMDFRVWGVATACIHRLK